MPLPVDYDSPQGEADAEVAVRGAIRELFLSAAVEYGFEPRHAQVTPRYPDTEEAWLEISSIPDPDTVAADPGGGRNLTRFFSVEWVGMGRRLAELTFRYDLTISMGFKDEYASAPGVRSYDELVALAMKFGKLLADNQELGLDDRVSHAFLQVNGRPRWTPEDDQGNATVTLDGALAVTLQVCKFG